MRQVRSNGGQGSARDRQSSHLSRAHDPRRAARRIGPPTWSTWPEAVSVVCYPPHLRKTVAIALIVGTVSYCIDQLQVVLRAVATTPVWIKSAITYLVPSCASNAGVPVASRVADDGRS